MRIPGLPEIVAAWHGLPIETRDRIGVIAVDMVFQAFVHGDAYVVTGHPEDCPVLNEEIQGAAAQACDARLTELHAVIEEVLPALFGPDGENPAWCENPGARP